jgi:hypothetical protein
VRAVAWKVFRLLFFSHGVWGVYKESKKVNGCRALGDE